MARTWTDCWPSRTGRRPALCTVLHLVSHARRRSASKGKAPAIQYTALGWCFLFVGLVVLFAGLATGTLAPTSWLGAQVQTPLGAIGYWFCVWIAFSVVEWALRRIGVPLVRLPASTSPSALADPAAPASGSAVSSE